MPASIRTLRNIAIVGGFIALGGAGYFTVKIQNHFRETEYYKKSLVLLRNYAPIENSIGRPIQGSSINLGDFDNNVVDGLNAKIAIPVTGPKGNGTLYCFASRPTLKDSWQINQLDIETQKNNQRWTFYKLPTSESDSSKT